MGRVLAVLWVATLALLGMAAPGPVRATAEGAVALAPYAVETDAIPAPLAGLAGDASRGLAIALDRTGGNCLICHKVPVPEEPFQGELGPDLMGVGMRLTAGQIRLRLVDQSRLDPATLMPPYYRADNLVRVADRFGGQPVLSAQQIEDLVAWLVTLKEQKTP